MGSSTLLEPDKALPPDTSEGKVADAVVMLSFDDEWQEIQKIKVVPLPVQQCQAHRILYAQVGEAAKDECLFVTLFSASGILQICDLQNIAMEDFGRDDYGLEKTSRVHPE